MAEIRVEKKRTNIWPWIIGLILVALLIWGIAAMTNNRNQNNVDNTRTSALQPAPITMTISADAPYALAA
jgi:glucose uptake protein GlcU